MNIWKDPQYHSLKVLLIIVAVFGIGAFSLSAMRGFDLSGRVYENKLTDAEKLLDSQTTTGPSQVFLLGGLDGENQMNDVWRSSQNNLVNWLNISPNNPETTSKWAERSNHTAVYWQNKIWLIGGGGSFPEYDLSKIWHSPDGVIWTSTPTTGFPIFGNQSGVRMVLFANKLWMFFVPTQNVGDFVNITGLFSSTDGFNWQSVAISSESNQCINRTDAEVIVFQNKMYVIGGTKAGGPIEDNATDDGGSYDTGGVDTQGPAPAVCSSIDGENWIVTAQNTDFQNSLTSKTLINHSPFVLGNKLYIFGGRMLDENPGLDSNSVGHFISSTQNGMVWETFTNPPTIFHNQPLIRENTQVFILGTKAYILAGNEASEIGVFDDSGNTYQDLIQYSGGSPLNPSSWVTIIPNNNVSPFGLHTDHVVVVKPGSGIPQAPNDGSLGE